MSPKLAVIKLPSMPLIVSPASAKLSLMPTGPIPPSSRQNWQTFESSAEYQRIV